MNEFQKRSFFVRWFEPFYHGLEKQERVNGLFIRPGIGVAKTPKGMTFTGRKYCIVHFKTGWVLTYADSYSAARAIAQKLADSAESNEMEFWTCADLEPSALTALLSESWPRKLYDIADEVNEA